MESKRRSKASLIEQLKSDCIELTDEIDSLENKIIKLKKKQERLYRHLHENLNKIDVLESPIKDTINVSDESD